MSIKKEIFGFIVVLALATGCILGKQATVSEQVESTSIIELVATSTFPPSATYTLTRSPTLTPSVTLPVSTLAFIGTDLPEQDQVIDVENIDNLTQAAQWGRGTILATAFSPDNTKIIVASAFGLASYDRYQLDLAPIWIPFDQPVFFRDMVFSQDGRYIRLLEIDKVFDFIARAFVSEPENVAWTEPAAWASNWGVINAESPVGDKRLRSIVEYDPNFMDIEYSIRTVSRVPGGDFLFALPDETFYVTYEDRHDPEGCDLSSTAMCGNALSPAAYHPYRAIFSPTGDTLAILYRAPNLWNSDAFSVLRIYDGNSGRLLSVVGNLQKPVATFSYEPTGANILVAYVDGSIQLWNIGNNSGTFGAWHFNHYLTYVQYTQNGRFLALKRPDRLEFRSTDTGALRASYTAVAYALSPVDSNIVAIADLEDVIKIIEIDTGRVLVTIRGHSNTIFALAFSPDGNYLASSSRDCQIKFWDAHTGEFVHYFEETIANGYFGGPPPSAEDEEQYGPIPGNSRVFIKDFEFIPGTNQLIGFGSWGTVVNWNADSGATNYVIYSAPLEFYNGMWTVSPHYPEIFGVDIENNMLIIGNTEYNLQTGEQIGEHQTSSTAPEGCAAWGAISTDGQLLFTLGYDNRDGQVCVLDADNLHLLRTITVVPQPTWEFTVAGLSLSPDGTQLMLATTLGAVYIYRVNP